MEYNASEGYFGEDDPDATDKEWDDFAKLVEKKRKPQEQAFYPCPPQEEDYVSTLVRILDQILNFLIYL